MLIRLSPLGAVLALGGLLVLTGCNEGQVTGSDRDPGSISAKGGGGGGGGGNPPPAATPTLVSITLFPPRLGGGGPATGRATFNGPATDAARVLLSVSQPDIVQIPSEVVVIKNASSADFRVTTSRVGAPTTATITGTACCGGAGSATGTLTVTTDPPPPPDVVQGVRADFKPGGRGGTLSVQATSSSPTAILTVFRDGFEFFDLTNRGGGRYDGSFSFSGVKPQTVTVKSNLGGQSSAAVK